MCERNTRTTKKNVNTTAITKANRSGKAFEPVNLVAISNGRRQAGIPRPHDCCTPWADAKSHEILLGFSSTAKAPRKKASVCCRKARCPEYRWPDSFIIPVSKRKLIEASTAMPRDQAL